MTHGIKGPHRNGRLPGTGNPRYRGEGINLKILRTIAIWNHVQLSVARIHVHSVRVARKQIHDRRASQPKLRGVELILEGVLAAIEQNEDLRLIALACAQGSAQVGESKKQKPFG